MGAALLLGGVSTHTSTWEATGVSGHKTRCVALFQPTPPRGRRLGAVITALRHLQFQPTPPRGRRPHRHPTSSPPPARFNPHLHAGGDSGRGCPVPTIRFQPTPPRGRRHRASAIQPQPGGFNPHLHAGGDEIVCPPLPMKAVFQPTPPRGRRPARAVRVSGDDGYEGFNPHLHAGGDSSAGSSGRRRRCFNPHLHAGGDRRVDSAQERAKLFQPTPPRGRRRPVLRPAVYGPRSFNPHLHAGGDLTCITCDARGGRVSTHTSTREATGARSGG